MKIEIEVSDKNEGTASPWWIILDPQQNMRCDVHWLAHQITGPFFSREEADLVFKQMRHHFSDRARVYCASGYCTYQYDRAYKAAAHRQMVQARIDKLENIDSVLEKIELCDGGGE